MKEGNVIATILIAGSILYGAPLTIRISKLEHDINERLEGKIYCAVCNRYEDVRYVDMGIGRGLFDTVVTFSIKTDNHIDKETGECESFEVLATTSWMKLKRIEVGTHPGCSFECRGCDKWGWDKTKTTPR